MPNTNDVSLDGLLTNLAAAGCPPEDAAGMLRDVALYFGVDPTTLPHVVGRIVAGSGLPPFLIVAWLYDAMRIVAAPHMDEVLGVAALRAMLRKDPTGQRLQAFIREAEDLVRDARARERAH